MNYIYGNMLACIGFFLMGFGTWWSVCGSTLSPNPLWAFPVTVFLYTPALIAGAYACAALLGK